MKVRRALSAVKERHHFSVPSTQKGLFIFEQFFLFPPNPEHERNLSEEEQIYPVSAKTLVAGERSALPEPAPTQAGAGPRGHSVQRAVNHSSQASLSNSAKEPGLGPKQGRAKSPEPGGTVTATVSVRLVGSVERGGDTEGALCSAAQTA